MGCARCRVFPFTDILGLITDIPCLITDIPGLITYILGHANIMGYGDDGFALDLRLESIKLL